MFFKKQEQKKHSACVILTVGALAAVGAVSITRCGKRFIKGMCEKMKSFFCMGNNEAGNGEN